MRGSLHTGAQPIIPEPRAHAEACIPVDETACDELLIADLRSLQPDQFAYPADKDVRAEYLNPGVAELICSEYSAEQISRLESHLGQNGTFNIPIAYGTVWIEQSPCTIPFVAATETDANHGEMSSMLYLRDHIQTARAFMELYVQDPARYEFEGSMGRQLLRSALLLMSTPSQLDRFERVIDLGPQAGQADWPQISLYFNDLEGSKPNGWRNQQDTLQMLGHLTFDAIERGFIDVTDLTERDEQFLGYLTPFLAAVGFPRHQNSGSWEEITAVRTSVMAVETSLLHKISRHIAQDDPDRPKYGFLHLAYEKYRPADAPEHLEDALQSMVDDGLTALGRRLPFESTELDHDPGSIKLREADAALVYVLMYDLPRLLADHQIPIGENGAILSAHQIEDMVVSQLNTLMDPETGGMKRYQRDSYQRTNFHTHATQRDVAAIKRQVRYEAERTGSEPNLDRKQWLRDKVVEDGREAAWTHPLSQLSAWAAKRSLEADEPFEVEWYRELSTHWLNQALRLVTGHGQYTAALQADSTYRTQLVPAYKLPECYITYRDAQGDIIVPSPHTPLNWSSAMLREATGLLNVSTRQAYSRLLSRFCLGMSRY